jgi:nucleoid DNA-binding protein
MTISDLAAVVAIKVGLSEATVQDILEQTVNEIVEGLINTGRSHLPRIGTFQLRKRKARKGRNPRTGEKVLVPETMVVTFQTVKELKDRLRLVSDLPGNA